MENQEGSNPEGEPTVPTGMVPPRKPSGNAKWYAIIVVLLVVAAGFAVLAFYHPAPGTGSTVTVKAADTTATIGQPFNLTLQTNGQWQSLQVFFGDGSSQFVPYTGSTTVTLSHTYTNPGNYYVYYVAKMGSTTVNNAQSLIPVKTTLGSVPATSSVGLMTLESSASATAIANTSYAYNVGSNLSYVVGYFTPPANSNYQVYSQVVNEYMNGSLVKTFNIPYTWNQADQAYELANANAFLNFTNLSQGYYVFGLSTYTGALQSQVIPSTITNTTMVNYAAADSATYNATANVTVFGGKSLPYTLYSLGYTTGTNVSMLAKTNVSYMSATSVATPLAASVSYGAATEVTFYNGANVTFTKETNFTLAHNVTVYNMSSHAATVYNNTTTFHVLAGAQLNFTSTADVTFTSEATLNFVKAATANYTGSSSSPVKVDYLSDLTVQYLANTTLMYTNSQTTVTYPDATSVATTFLMNGPTSTSVYTGTLDTSSGTYNEVYYQDVAIFNNAKEFVSTAVASQFLNSELETGAYKTLDPAIEYDTVSNEILMNTMATLDVYQGSSNSTFAPFAASYLPTEANGGINTNYANWTVSTPWGSTYTESVVPGQNYTFHIRSNATFQDGTSMTAWDVYYSMVRVLLFDAGSPGTPGWIIAQSMLPGDYYSTNTFFNITQNMTVDNATNNITFHFQSSLSPTFVFETIGYDLYIVDANWMLDHATAAAPGLSWKGGANTLPWNQTGFTAYQAQANQGSYNNYFVNNVMSSGPYMISYIVPASQVVLVKNPNFNSPNQWVPAAHIDKVILQYVGQPSTNYLLLSSGQAQAAGLPVSSWGQVNGLIQKGVVNNYGIPTLSIFWYNFNTQVNQTMLSGIVPQANMPFSLFTNYFARKAFAYAFNYTEAVTTQFGNPDFPSVPFASTYAGMLPAGMAYAQTVQDLNQTGVTNGVPYFNLTLAKQNWKEAVNGTGSGYHNLGSLPGKLNYSNSANGFTYNGKALNIPIFIFSADPASLAATTTWVSFLKEVIPGAQFEVLPTSFPVLLGYMYPGQNPMPIYELGWAPDYPYPSDYLGPMAYPSNSSTYPGPNSMTAWWIGGGNTTMHNPLGNASQAHNLTMMADWYNIATSTPNVNIAEQYFHMMNEMLINMTFYTYIFQQYQHVIISSKILPSSVTQYQLNIMVAGQAALKYSALQYS